MPFQEADVCELAKISVIFVFGHVYFHMSGNVVWRIANSLEVLVIDFFSLN
jgi:hypothetical protein